MHSSRQAEGREWSGGDGSGVEWSGGQGRVPDCLGGLSRVGISSRSTRPWNGQPPSSLLLPHINYCWTTWGYQCHRLQKLQKRAIRIITLSKYNDHMAPLFKKLNLLTIKDILALQELQLYYKFIHNNLPPYIQQWQIKQNTNNYTSSLHSQSKWILHWWHKTCLRKAVS